VQSSSESLLRGMSHSLVTRNDNVERLIDAEQERHDRLSSIMSSDIVSITGLKMSEGVAVVEHTHTEQRRGVPGPDTSIVTPVVCIV
jgi:hypothetical protein